MKHIKSINEYNKSLYNKITFYEYMELSTTMVRTSYYSEIYKQLSKLGKIQLKDLATNNNLGLASVNYIKLISLNDIIKVVQLEDEYYLVVQYQYAQNENYYKCDQVDGVIELINNLYNNINESKVERLYKQIPNAEYRNLKSNSIKISKSDEIFKTIYNEYHYDFNKVELSDFNTLINIENGGEEINIYKLPDEYYLVSEIIPYHEITLDASDGVNYYLCDELKGVMNLLAVIRDGDEPIDEGKIFESNDKLYIQVPYSIDFLQVMNDFNTSLEFTEDENKFFRYSGLDNKYSQGCVTLLIHGQYSSGDIRFIIGKKEDEWYYISMTYKSYPKYLYFKCDTFEGVKQLINDVTFDRFEFIKVFDSKTTTVESNYSCDEIKGVEQALKDILPKHLKPYNKPIDKL